MNTNLVSQLVIAATKPEVFTYLSNLSYHHLWNPHLLTITPKSKIKLGTTYRTSSLLLGVRVRGANKVTKFIPDKEVEIQNTTGALKYRVNYCLEAGSDGKTLIACTTSISSTGEAFAFAAPVLKLLARREIQADLQALKIAVEQQLE